MNEGIFRQYLHYRTAQAHELERPKVEGMLLSRHFENVPSTKAERKQYRKSKRFKALVREELEKLAVPPAFEYENAIHDEDLLREYMRLEPTALTLMEMGCKNIDFGNVHAQLTGAVFQEVDFDEEAEKCLDLVAEDAIRAISAYLSESRLCLPCERDDGWFTEWPGPVEDQSGRRIEMEEVDEHNIGSYALTVYLSFFSFACYVLDRDHTMQFMEESIASHSEAISALGEWIRDEFREENYILEKYAKSLSDSAWHIQDAFIFAMEDYFSEEKIGELVASNPHYRKSIKKKKARAEKKRELLRNIVEIMPESLEDLYPATRQIHRQFVLHIGPTNSGKTHDAMQAMVRIGSGVYLAPLRLLAYEQYEHLNAEGHPCSMVTGEEQCITENASFTASTIEMLRVDTHYACAVIDEAQMIADKNRGGAWTRAILGAAADVVHVCLAPEAEAAVIRLIDLCGDSYEIVRHDRKARLVAETDSFCFPASVRPHDALIVFSRRNVHAVAAELQQKKQMKCSIIYGALPYDVRHEEARKFLAGETDVIVSTDAIGMGMNLPIERVVFLETTKFDGEKVRMLRASEIRQIAGRAGRFGTFDKGFVNADRNKKAVRNALEKMVPLIQDIHVSFPEALIGLDGDLSDIITQWDKVKLQEGFVKESTDTLLNQVQVLERLTADKRLIYMLAAIPVDDRGERLHDVWEKLSFAVLRGEDLHLENRIEYLRGETDRDKSLSELEEISRLCDLLYNFDRRFCDSRNNCAIAEVRNMVSRKIMGLLSSSRLEARRCRYCGKMLPWNYEYGMCQKCHDDMYPYRGDFWNDWYA